MLSQRCLECASIAKYREEIEQAAWTAASCNVYTDSLGASGLAEVPTLVVERTVLTNAEYIRQLFVNELVEMLGGRKLFNVVVLDCEHMDRYCCPVIQERKWVYRAR